MFNNIVFVKIYNTLTLYNTNSEKDQKICVFSFR